MLDTLCVMSVFNRGKCSYLDEMKMICHHEFGLNVFHAICKKDKELARMKFQSSFLHWMMSSPISRPSQNFYGTLTRMETLKRLSPNRSTDVNALLKHDEI